MEKPVIKERPFGLLLQPALEYNPESAFEEFRNPTSSPLREAFLAIRQKKAEVVDAWLFCGRWDRNGKLFKETGTKPYKMLHLSDHGQFERAMEVARQGRNKLLSKLRRVESKRKESDNPQDFISFTDAGSIMMADPNQFTEFTPMFNGPFQRQQYWDFFKAISRAFEEWNHNPISKRLVNILAQYALGRGVKIECNNDDLQDLWEQHVHRVNLYHKMRKFWIREYLVNGELLIDNVVWNSIDSSTIYDIITDIENPDEVYYYQQMFQTYTQIYSGIDVPGVAGSKDTILGKYIIRQIPYDRVVMIKNECFSNEKRGRSILISILGWCKRLKDLYNAHVIGEEARASYIFDDTIKGSDADVQNHASRYAYMVRPASIFAHNESIKREILAPMTGVSPTTGGIGQEILALIATSMGIPKEHLNVIASGTGSRANAIVGSEPFTKVIEDLQQDFEELLYKLIESWCVQNEVDFTHDDWQVTFPAVTKDTTSDVIKNWSMAQAVGAVNKRRMSTAIATELEASSYDYDDELAQAKEDNAKGLEMAVTPLPPPGRLGTQPNPTQKPDFDPEQSSPLHGDEKGDIISQHKAI